MNLQRVRYFLAVADELHFGRAARRLHMAQPPLSQQIRHLEDELGVTLFERTTRRVALTAAGEMFLPAAERLVTAADTAERVMREFRTGDGGRLRLGFVDSASFQVMPRFLRAFRRRWPKVEHDLQIMSSAAQHDSLMGHAIDLGISRTPGAAPDLVSTEFLVEPLWLAVGEHDPLWGSDECSVAAIDSEALVGFDRRLSPSLHEQLRTLFEQAGLAYDPAIEATEYTTMLGLVSSGEGSAIVPDGVRTFTPEGVRYVRIADRGAHMSMYLNHRVDEPLRVVAQARDVVVDLFA